MAQDLSIEDPDMIFFTTTRTMNSRLWFVNNRRFEERVLAYLAKYTTIHQVTLYGFVIVGNHYHLMARFPRENKAAFFRDFNSMFARLTNTYVEEFPGGKVWARRARSQMVPNNEDVLNTFLYLSLNPVSSGLVERVSHYPCYNSFSDAISGKVREYKVVDWTDYHNRKRKNRTLTVAECTKVYPLKYTRLPGYEEMSDDEYREAMLKQFETRRQQIVETRRAAGQGFATKEKLRRIKPGRLPKSTKTSQRHSRRPLVLTLCSETRRMLLRLYFATLAAYRSASKRFRTGQRTVAFPKGTYAPGYYSGLAAP